MTNMLLRKGQVVIEYFILFAAIAVITIVSLTQFDDEIKNTVQGFFNAAANDIAN